MQQFKQYHFFSLLLVLLVSGCATTNQAPFPKQQYQDLTSRFNAYFNAKEKEKAVLQTVEKTHKDNYDEVISVFYYTNPKEFASSSSDLEDIEKRCTRSLQIHTVANYVDDHFLLIGKANYYKGDYEKALTNFKFVTTEYKEGVDYVKEMKRLKGKTVKPSKKKKPAKKAKFEKVLDAKGNLVLNKVDERPKYSLFEHEPARAEALLWLAKTYTAQEKYSEALSVIQYARNDDKFYKNLDKELLLTEANVYIQKKEYAQAIAPLEKFLTMTKKKKQRLRPLLALAQIHEKLGNHAQSAGFYKMALKSNPGYDMEFYAKMQQTRLSRKGKVNLEEVKKILVKMSHDGKYKEYLDQIYYELGEITLGENNRSVAREWYHKSINNSTTNTVQKSQSFLRLAQMDFEEEIYRASKFNYDSAITGMSSKDTLYETTVKRGKVLGRLVENLDVIAEQDSLQRVAKMSDAERSKFIKKLIAQKEKELEKKEREKSQPVLNNNNLPTPNVSSTSGSEEVEAAWYFYNPMLRGNGYNEFIRKWGKRKFEDNWRRKDKTSSSSDNTADADTLKQQQEDKDAVTTDESKYLAGLPMTEAKITQSNDKLIDAYYNAGTIYKDDLNSNRKANQMFDELVRKFPKSKLNLEAYYQIYLIALKTKNQARANEYKSKIIAEYPDSKIAKYIQDPEYLNKLKESENAVANYYQSTYEDYSKGLYVEAIEKCKLADVKFKPNTFKPKFDLLNAMIEAKQNRLDDYVQSLNKIITKHNGTPEQEMAKKLLADLNKSKLPMLDLSKQIVDTMQIDTIAAKTPEPALPSTADISAMKTTLETNKSKFGEALAKFVNDSIEKTKKEVKPEYKPLSKSERLDSIMKAQKNPKPAATTTKVETPAPVTKQDTVKSTYKPLSKSERLDSIMKAAKKAPAKPFTNQSSTPSPKVDTLATKQTVVAKDTVKKATATKVDTTKNKSTTKPQPKPVVKDSVTAKSNPVVKDTLKKVTVAKTDSSKIKVVAKPAVKPAAKTDTVKPKAIATKTDTAKQKSTQKSTVVSPKPDTVKVLQPIVSANNVVVDSNDKEPIYGLSDAAPHQIVIYFKNGDQFSSAMVAKLETFEQSKFAGVTLTNRSVILDSKNKLILVKSFGSKTDALAAAKTLQTGIAEAIGVSSEEVYVFAISTLNYTTLISTKRLGNYLNFYMENYK
ncbi:MAG: tetratricopeptide repeat protein [Chitinophagales bacterium]